MTLFMDGEKMETIRVKKEKESKFKSILRWNDKNKQTVLKTTIPAKVVDRLQLTAGDEIIYNIKETSLNVFQCEITFKSDDLEHLEKSPIETASNTDAQMTKTVETKTDADNENKPLELDGLPLTIGKYLIQATKNPFDSIEVRDTKANVRDTFIGISKRTDENIEALINDLSLCENIDEIHYVLNEYRKQL